MNRLPMLLVAALCALFAVMMSAPAQAQQPPCMPLPEFLRILSDEYGETPERRGYENSGAAVMVTANHEAGTWTILMVTPNGAACGVAAGQAWEAIEPKPAGREG